MDRIPTSKIKERAKLAIAQNDSPRELAANSNSPSEISLKQPTFGAVETLGVQVRKQHASSSGNSLKLDGA
jgi:hypothetical protein